MNVRTLLAGMIATTMLSAGLACGQMVPDAPKEPSNPAKEIKKGVEDPPVRSRPVTPKKMIAQKDKDGNITFVPDTSAQPAAETTAATNPRPVKAVEPPPAYKSLVERDSQGNLIPLKEPVDIAALRQNPLIDAETMAKVEPYLAERRAKLEQIVVENLNVIDQIQGGALNNISLGDQEGLNKVRALIKPLMAPNAPKALMDELRARSVVNQRQADLNKTIASEYARATMPKSEANANPDQKKDLINDMMSHTLRQSVSESLFVHRELVMEAGAKMSDLLPSLGLAADVVDKAKAAMPKGGDSEAHFKGYSNAMAQLPLEKRQELLKALIAARASK